MKCYLSHREQFSSKNLFLCWFGIFSWFQLILLYLLTNDKFTERILGRYCSLRICNWSKRLYLLFMLSSCTNRFLIHFAFKKKSLKLSVLYLERWPSPLFLEIWGLNAPIWVGLPSSSIHFYPGHEFIIISSVEGPFDCFGSP